MKLELLVLFFTYLESTKNIYENLLDIVKQKFKTKDYFLINLEKKYYVFKVAVDDKEISFQEFITEAFRSEYGFKGERIKYNTADEALQKVCDYYLFRNFNKLQEFTVFCKLVLHTSENDINFNLKQFFYDRVQSDFIAKLYDSNKQKQIEELCLSFSRNRMVDTKFCFSLIKRSYDDTIKCFEEENKMKFFFPVKLRNLMLFFKIDVKDLYNVEKQYTTELIKLHNTVNNDNNSTDVCTLITKVFTFSDFVSNYILLNDAINDEYLLDLLNNFDNNFFNVSFKKKVVSFENLGTSFCYSCCYNLLNSEENCQLISEETYQDCNKILDLYTKTKDIDFARYKIIFHKFKTENLLDHVLYEICKNPGSASYLILMQILGHYNILNVSEIIVLTQNINDNNRGQIIASLKHFFTKEKLSKIYFMMTPKNEEVNNLLYTLIAKEADEFFSNYKKKDILNIEFFNDIQKFSNLYLGHNKMTINSFYGILIGSFRFIISSGEKTLKLAFESIALLTNVDVWYRTRRRHIFHFYRKNAEEVFQKLNIDDPDNLEKYVESLNK
ncbi:hypothetical protein AAJ76_1080004419 [Vairimorpha ceranae]|uniref:Uncharacterized protein n=1 Tax=Vairimorpha ceranae TaxID=40302 RepID=A0A0F9W8Y7_9MICR|nr:hypothetical protein AAJ76_1080004419 [Vairimorpha ceranae]KKO74161.1 hypothetical protein AAJ76_1080004419 [Vairimorpha ceranae]